MWADRIDTKQFVFVFLLLSIVVCYRTLTITSVPWANEVQNVTAFTLLVRWQK